MGTPPGLLPQVLPPGGIEIPTQSDALLIYSADDGAWLPWASVQWTGQTPHPRFRHSATLCGRAR
eukprot:5272924-Prymnesium_polylepis.1